MGKFNFIFRLSLPLFYYFSVLTNICAESNESITEDYDNSNSFNYFYNFDPIISDPLIEIDTNASIKFNKKRDSTDHRLTDEAKIKILEHHNLYRGNVTPPAGNMAFLEWDDDLEHLAQIWADTCVFDHGKPKNVTYPGTYGQNLYIGTDPTGLLGIWMWYEEYRDYDLHNKTCPPEKMCGHYLTMAWAESNKIGCAMTRCGFRYYLVCHYSPAALKGLPIYDVSKPCSQCASNAGTLCYRNLCMTKEQCQRNPMKCNLAKCNLKCHNCGKLDASECQCHCADGWDSHDCSRLCTDVHARCGVKPGFPNKATCSLNKYAVANVYCRKMCEKCHPFSEDTTVSHHCCDGNLCPNGYVLDMYKNMCRCKILCPGPLCDDMDGKGSLVNFNISLLIASLLTFYLTSTHRKDF